MSMTTHEKYLFDLQGFLVIPDALDKSQVTELNRIVDERVAAEVAPDATTHRFGGLLEWGQPYLDLSFNPRVEGHLSEIVDPRFRLDHVYLDVIRSGLSPIGAHLHGGGAPFNPVSYFNYRDGRFHCALTVVAYNLRDVGPGDGGFACVPGSHKANFPYPETWKHLTDLPAEAEPLIRRVTGPAGTAVIFTEALTHGPLPWTAAGERRTAFYKYNSHTTSWAAGWPAADRFDGLEERKQEILEGPNARYPRRHDPERAV